PIHQQATHLASREEFRNFEAEGERSRRQPDRNSGGRRLASGGHSGGGLSSGQLRKLRPGTERGGTARDGHFLLLRLARGRPDEFAQPHGGDIGTAQKGNPRPPPEGV